MKYTKLQREIVNQLETDASYFEVDRMSKDFQDRLKRMLGDF